jgi:hypothetical protein
MISCYPVNHYISTLKRIILNLVAEKIITVGDIYYTLSELSSAQNYEDKMNACLHILHLHNSSLFPAEEVNSVRSTYRIDEEEDTEAQ